MARRKDHSSEELIALAVEAAERIVRAEGLAALSARRLAGEIGYTPGTLYNHFADFDEIVLRLNARSLARLKEAAQKIARRNGLDARARVHALADAYAAFAKKEPQLWAALTGFRRSKPAPPPKWYLAEAEALITLLAGFLGAVQPGLDAKELRYRARRLWASIHGVCALAGAGAIGRALVKPMERMVHDLVDLQCSAP